MNDQTDQQLLRAYVEQRSEPAFAELVRRHLDFVYSAARRMVCDSHLAEDVAQGVFLALAKNAPQLMDHPVLSGWLHRTAQNIAAQTVRADVRRRVREQEAAAMNELLATEPDALWEHIAPLLDAALGELNDGDRDALLLRYFERKSAREMAQILGTSEDAAQKRVSRATERMREFLTKRGVAVGAGGLVGVITANAVQAAPAGLAATISTAAALAGTAVATTTATATATKVITMTALQKTLIATTLIVAAGSGIYEAHQASTLRTQVLNLEQQAPPFTAQIQQLQRERDAATNRLAALADELEKTKSNNAELLKLRSQVTQLREAQPQSSRSAKSTGLDPNDPGTQAYLAAKMKAEQITRYLQQMPDKTIPEIKLLTDVDWLVATKEANFDTDADVRKTLRKIRDLAKNRLPMGRSLNAFLHASNGQLPTDVSQLKPYITSALGDTPMDDATLNAILQRYELLHTGTAADYPKDTWFIAEKAPVDKDYDSRAKFGDGLSTVITTGVGEAGDPDDNSY